MDSSWSFSWMKPLPCRAQNSRDDAAAAASRDFQPASPGPTSCADDDDDDDDFRLQKLHYVRRPSAGWPPSCHTTGFDDGDCHPRRVGVTCDDGVDGVDGEPGPFAYESWTVLSVSEGGTWSQRRERIRHDARSPDVVERWTAWV